MSENTTKKYLDYDGLSHFWDNVKNYINTLPNNAKSIINAGTFNTEESLINYPFEEGQLYQFCLSGTLCSSTVDYEHNEFLAVYLKDSDKFDVNRKQNGLLFIDLRTGISGQINLSEFDYLENSLYQPIPFDLNYRNLQQLSRINGLKRGTIYRFRIDEGGDLWDQTFKAENYCIGIIDELADSKRYHFIDLLSGKCGIICQDRYGDLFYQEYSSIGEIQNAINNLTTETQSIRALISSHKTTNDAKFAQLENLDGILNVGVVNTIEEFKDNFFDNHNGNGDIATGKIFTFTLTEEFSQSLGCSKGSYIGFVVDGAHTADKDFDGSWNCKVINIRKNYLYDLYVPSRNYGTGGEFSLTRKQYLPKNLTSDWFNGYTGLDDILNNIGYRLSFSQEEITKDNVMWYTGDGTSNAPQYLNGNRSLTNSTCTITGCVTILDGWEHIYYSLPKTAIETTVAYGVSSSGQRIKFVTDTHENTSVLHFTPAAGGGFSAGELDFTFTYKIKGDI